ncbi:MAG: hypothetical protein VKO44_05795 [Cyanobacteriota bacterium]|nr:hypothetical protein [Cyanobacteriota bacterium]
MNSRRRSRWRLDRHRRPSAQALPLAVGAVGLLLLMSLSLHALAMQERLQVGALERLRREEDLLVSAAHQWLQSLNDRHSCLLRLPLARWDVEGSACASAAELAELRRRAVLGRPVRLLAWQPAADGLRAEFELRLEAGAGRAPRRGRFGAQLEGTPPWALEPRRRSLTGALP